jgi:MFS transporter, Spinster family, sphingosine-1-phosphate transporter
VGNSSRLTPTGAATAQPRHEPEEVRPTASTHGWFAVIWTIYLIDYADRFAISAVLPAIQQEFSLNDSQLGLMSGSLFLGLALLAVPCGLAVDRFSRKYMITLMTLVWSAATWSTGLARSFGELVAARIMVGAGEAGYNPAGYSLIAAWYPQRLRGTMVGLFNMAQPLGVGVGIILAGHLAAQFGWRAVFGVLALPGVILALVMLFAPDYKTRKIEADGNKTIKPGLMDTLRYIAGNRTLQLIYLAQLPISMYMMSCAIWGPTFFVRQYQLSLADAASLVGVITMVAGMGALAGGWLSDRVSRGNPRARVTVCLLYLAVPLVLHSVAILGSMRGLPLPLVITVYSCGQFFLAANWGTLVAASLDQSPVPYRASCQSFLPMFQAISGLGAGVISGLISEQLGLPWALEILLVAGMISALILLNWARRHYDEDYQRQSALGTFKLDLD